MSALLTLPSLVQAQENSSQRLQTIDCILNTITSVNATLYCQLTAAHTELKKYEEVDRRTKATNTELDKIFDRIDPVLMALIKIARENSTVVDFEPDFKAYMDCHAEQDG